ncbi:hypothetical protein D9R08_18395 [Rhodophyticola porphyridii]|uniref:Uncharacterized protein n=1 Tax=Rhodophyticola porphyridii TaxID=1852017 RepID=A0A3L9XZV4_9RHOB|nr:hypothetical protein D9R08_18395 [Rhodophyticola porphyridii]
MWTEPLDGSAVWGCESSILQRGNPNLSRQAAQQARGAVGIIGQGVMGLANRLATSLRGIGPRTGNAARSVADDVVTGGNAARSSANAERLREFFRQLEKMRQRWILNPWRRARALL